ncbi:MAG: class I SAM-dependent rRNA methyltransferase [Candidatus Kapaibacterium sp.]|nr:class I SAM-dependent rRNA methyltransferase [Candidatus Kapabacteria bacterium]
MNKVYIKKNAERKIRRGYLWIFSNELEKIPDYESGTVVEVIDSHGNNYGVGFFNPNSLISVRLLKSNREPDLDFFVARIYSAYSYRLNFFTGNESMRLIYGESDYLPGLIIDKYNDTFVMQIQSAGIETRKQIVVQALLKVFPNTKCIITRTNSRLREIEGLPNNDELLYGKSDENIEITENGIKYIISVDFGQKTGFFLDQRFNRQFIAGISRGKKVLDCYTNQGGFALNSALGGALSVDAIDISEQAIQSARRNAEINKLKVNFEIADVFRYMNDAINADKKWDIVILDPPAFTKSKKTIKTAISAYHKLNKIALNILNDGGYLVSSSCSHHLSENDFLDLIQNAAAKMNRQLKIVHRGYHSPDHPVLSSMPETYYLKFFVFKVESI